MLKATSDRWADVDFSDVAQLVHFRIRPKISIANIDNMEFVEPCSSLFQFVNQDEFLTFVFKLMTI